MNKLVVIQYMNSNYCYLNVPKDEAIHLLG